MGYRSRIIDRRIIAGELMILRCEKPEGFNYVAGQFCFLTVPDLGFPDSDGLRKPLSLASSPLESELILTVRLTKSAFKTTMRELPLGSVVEFDSPAGTFTLPSDLTAPVVFLAGGIGVSPFRSMLRYAADAPTHHTLTLFYSSRAPEEALFLEEFTAIAAARPRTTVVATVSRTDSSGADWTGLTGRISREMVEANCRDWAASTYYLAGPPPMVDGMQTMLDQMGITRARIKREVWAGYR